MSILPKKINAGKYYLVDSGYPNRTGYLAPYKGERYHGLEYRQGHPPHTPKEVFNYAHSSLRNVIERTFGMWKNRFCILHNMPTFKLTKQIKIVVATATLHNYIIMNDDNDLYKSATFGEEKNGRANCTADADIADSNGSENLSGTLWMNAVHDAIAGDLVATRGRR